MFVMIVAMAAAFVSATTTAAASPYALANNRKPENAQSGKRVDEDTRDANSSSTALLANSNSNSNSNSALLGDSFPRVFTNRHAATTTPTTTTTTTTTTLLEQQSRRKLSYSQTYSNSVSVETFVVPAGVAIFSVDAYGAQGGDWGNGGFGGKGGYISVSNIAAAVGQTFYVVVGAAGVSNSAPGQGGAGSCTGQCGVGGFYYTTGGGATDLRTSSSDLSSRFVIIF